MLLAIDRTLPLASMALFRDDGLLAAAVAETPERRASRPWESLLDDALATADAPVADIDRIAVGLGPGSFSGIRTALSFAKGLALPANAPVLGYPSTAAMALESFRAHPTAPEIILLGDARRGTFWMAICHRDEPIPSLECLPEGEVLDRIRKKPGVPVLSPDFARLAPRASGISPFPGEGMRPLAQSLGEIALAFPGRAIVPPVPFYLHPAVAPR